MAYILDIYRFFGCPKICNHEFLAVFGYFKAKTLFKTIFENY